jgi:hypothetical protein
MASDITIADGFSDLTPLVAAGADIADTLNIWPWEMPSTSLFAAES